MVQSVLMRTESSKGPWTAIRAFLEKVEQSSHSVALISAPLLAETDAKVSGTTGAFCFPHRGMQKKRGAIVAEVLAYLAGSYGKHFPAYCKGEKRSFQQKIPALVWKAIYKDFFESKQAQCAATGAFFDEKHLPQQSTLQHVL